MTGIEETAANVAEQTKLMNEAGSAWNAVKKGDLEVCLLAQFPSHIEIRLPCDKKCRCGVPAHHKLAKSRVHRRCSILCAYRPSHSIICPCRHVPVAYSVPRDLCLQHPLSLQTITQHHLSLQTITQLFPAVGDVYQVGAVGENVFHIAMLLNTPSSLAIARYLATLYGTDLVNTPYQERKAVSDPPGLYEGETALHIAIVNHDLAMVKFLVAHGADVRARAYGGFFDIGGPVYYGEYPLSFAASLGQKDIVTFLHQHGATPAVDAGASSPSWRTLTTKMQVRRVLRWPGAHCRLYLIIDAGAPRPALARRTLPPVPHHRCRRAAPFAGLAQRTSERQHGATPAVDAGCLLYTSPSPRDRTRSRMPSSA